MLIHSNASVEIQRMVETSWTESLSSVKTDYGVYINARSENLSDARDGQKAYEEFLMMTDWSFDIRTWDRIIWWSRNFVVQWGREFSDLTWKHWQYKIMEKHDE
jgi:hypothetical protein